MPDSPKLTVHLISDSTGETLHAVARAALAPFAAPDVAVSASVFVRSARDLDAALAALTEAPGLVFYTLVDSDHRARLIARAADLGVQAIAVLDPLIAALARHLGPPADHRPGMQHRVDADYLRRVAALDFAITYDDGASGTRLAQAEVILTGVSRTSKTPTCIYLAYRGVKAANVPLVPGRDPSPAFFAAMASGTPVIGLTASPARLAQIRAQRLETLGQTTRADYADMEAIRAEVATARLFFDRHAIPVIDVTRRSIEETAAEILMLLRHRSE